MRGLCSRNRNRFCSADCRTKVTGWRQACFCGYCGKSVTGKNRKFCDSSCAAKCNNRKRKPKANAFCSFCGKAAKRPENKYCCYSCAARGRRQEAIELYLRGEVVPGPAFLKSYLKDIRGEQCVICGLTEWTGQKVPLVLDHIDGNSDNNHISNLRLVCGNCDMLLPTHKSKNRGNGRVYRRQRYAQGKSY